jgi:hypothetical protein
VPGRQLAKTRREDCRLRINQIIRIYRKRLRASPSYALPSDPRFGRVPFQRQWALGRRLEGDKDEPPTSVECAAGCVMRVMGTPA